jgi:large subunit ribosomal protein L35
MSKHKNHSGASKRFKVTASGKIKHRAMNRSHNLGDNKKPKKRKRHLKRDQFLTNEDKFRVDKMMHNKRYHKPNPGPEAKKQAAEASNETS